MPIYDFVCVACGHQFEVLVRGTDAPTCVACGSTELERLLSLPAVKSDATHARAMSAARRRDAGQAKDRAHEQLRYERSHDD